MCSMQHGAMIIRKLDQSISATVSKDRQEEATMTDSKEPYNDDDTSGGRTWVCDKIRIETGRPYGKHYPMRIRFLSM